MRGKEFKKNSTLLLCLLFSRILYENQERVELIDRESDTTEAGYRTKQGFLVMPVFYCRRPTKFGFPIRSTAMLSSSRLFPETVPKIDN